MIKDLLYSIVIYGFAGSISSLIGFFLIPIYTKTFTPSEYGIIEIINTIIMFMSILGMLQLESAVARHFYEADNEEERKFYISTAFWTIAFFSIFWMIVIILFSGIISTFLLNDIKYKKVIIASSFIIPLSNFYMFFSIIMRFMKKPIQFSLFMIVQLIGVLSFSILFVVVFEIGIIGAFYGRIAGFICTNVIILLYLRKNINCNFDFKKLQLMLKYSLPLVPSTGGSWINSYASRLIMLGYLSLYEIGIYSVAFKIASIFTLFENAFRMAWGPFMWEQFNKENHIELYKIIAKTLMIITFSVVIIFSLFSKELLNIFTSKDYLQASRLIGIILFAFGMRMINQVICLGPRIRKKTIYNTVSFFISVGIHIICLLILLPIHGLIAVPISLVIGNLILNIINWYFSEKMYYIGFSRLLYFFIVLLTFITLIVFRLYIIAVIYKMFISFILIFFIIYFIIKSHRKLLQE